MTNEEAAKERGELQVDLNLLSLCLGAKSRKTTQKRLAGKEEEKGSTQTQNGDGESQPRCIFTSV